MKTLEIYLEQPKKQIEFETNLNNGKSIRIVSCDSQDRGKFYLINPGQIISIESDLESDNESLVIWWEWFNPLEGRNFTNSATFENYEFID